MARRGSPSSRATITRSARLSVYRRDGYRCLECGWTPSVAVESSNFLTLDHIIPRARGGSNRQENLQTLCFFCNAAKGCEKRPRLPKRLYLEQKRRRKAGVDIPLLHDDAHRLLPRYQPA